MKDGNWEVASSKVADEPGGVLRAQVVPPSTATPALRKTRVPTACDLWVFCRLPALTVTLAEGDRPDGSVAVTEVVFPNPRLVPVATTASVGLELLASLIVTETTTLWRATRPTSIGA